MHSLVFVNPVNKNLSQDIFASILVWPDLVAVIFSNYFGAYILDFYFFFPLFIDSFSFHFFVLVLGCHIGVFKPCIYWTCLAHQNMLLHVLS